MTIPRSELLWWVVGVMAVMLGWNIFTAALK